MTGDDRQPGLRALLKADIEALGAGARSPFFYLAALVGLNKFSVVLLFRLAVLLRRKGRAGRLLAGFLTRVNTLLNSCELSPLARIGPGLHVPHTVGICIGPIIAGRDLTILHHASIGIGDRTLDLDDLANYPSIGDGVQIGPGAVVLGSIHLGDRAIVAANAVVLQDVPAGATAFGNPARIMKLASADPA